MTSPFGVVDYEALRRLHQRATEAAERANSNPDDDATGDAAQSALEAYQRGVATYESGNDRATHRRRRAFGQQPEVEQSPSVVESVQRGVRGLLRTGVETVKALPRFALDVVNPVGLLPTAAGRRNRERVAEAAGSPILAVTETIRQARDPLAPPVTPEQSAGAFGGLAFAVGAPFARARVGARAIESSLAEKPVRPAQAEPGTEVVPPTPHPEPSPVASRALEQRVADATPANTDVAALRPQDYVRAEKLGFTEPESVSRLHEAAGEAIQAAREHGTDWRVPVTWTQTAEAAERLGLRPNEILRRPAERLNTVELEALKLVAERADDRIATLARQLGDETLTAGQRLDIETAYERTWAEYRTVVSHFSKARTEAGRNLNILRKVANRPLDPLVWQGIAERVHRGPLTTAEMQQVRGLVAAGDRTALVRGVAALGPGRRMAQFVTMVKAGYLSKPSTHARNIGSNLANVAFRNVADVPATLLDAAIAPLTGQHTKSFAGFLSADRKGAVEGVGAARRALREGVSPETIEAW